MYDTIIIGGGPSGVSAALYTVRAGLSTLIIENGPGALARAEKIENYYGLPSPISGDELYDIGLAQVDAFDVERKQAEVLSLGYGEKGYTVDCDTGNYEALSLIMAAGKPRKTLPVDGLGKLEGRGVSYCAVCDGFFFKGKRIAVLGESAYAAHEAAYLAGLTDQLYILTNGNELTAEMPENSVIRTEKLKSLNGDPSLESISFELGGDLPVDGLFIALGTASSADFAVKLGILTENGSITADKDQKTNVPGVFAAGDCTAGVGVYQISVAVGQGAVAGLSAIKYVKNAKK